MFRPNNFEPVNRNSSFNSMDQDDQSREQSSYSDENDTSNLSRIYHYETSEEADNENSEKQINCCPELNRRLVVYKAFYFLFFGAVGALFPYLAVFYKQLWLSPHQVGILIGLRPFIQMCASPLWGVLADTYNVSKWILLMSIGAWLASNYSISMVRPTEYEPSCSLNLTYLPMADDVDDQDFSWARIEPIVSKKNNITKPISDTDDLEKFGPLNNRYVSGKPGLDNKDYTDNGSLDEDYDDEKMVSYNDDDGNDPVGETNNINERDKMAEKSSTSSLYAVSDENASEIRDASIYRLSRNKTEGQLRNKTEDFKEKMNRLASRNKMEEHKMMEIINRMYNKRQSPKVKRSLKLIAGRNSTNIKEKEVQYAKGRESPLLKRKSETKLYGKDVDKNSKLHDIIYVKRTKHSLETPSDYSDEDSDEYLQDVLSSNERGEYYAESILPNQRVLAKEGLKEEFDSLKAAGGVFWPILNKADPTNSSDADNGSQSAETKKIFNILLAITICGTILSSPAATLSDTATLQALGDDKYRYGQQRLWGAFGWGIGAFIVGSIVSVTQEIKLCADPKHIDYILSFYVYAAVMILAFICALFFKFEPVGDISYKESFWEAFKLFADCQHLCFILTLLCSGIAMGFTHTFLFWHLHDMGGSQFLFSIIAAVQCISEVFMYFVSGYLILKIGCDSVLYIGLLANVLRLFAYSVITQPFYSVLLEVLQGISSASIWTAAVCYVGLNEGVQVTLQAMLHGIYWGLGHGGGGMLGGVVVSNLGSNATFIIFGICCIANLGILLVMKYWKKLFEFLSGYTSVETIPSGTYILVESQRAGNG